MIRKRVLALILALTGTGLAAQGSAISPVPQPDGPLSVAATPASTADHSKFEILDKDFASGPEVTEACLSCHTEADDQVMHSIHFNWDYTHPQTGQKLGKSNVINLFCGAVAGNEPRCTSCHAGYGWEDMNQPPPQQETAVDCLVCHDRSGQYTKSASGAGHPPLDPVKPGTLTITGAEAWAVDLKRRRNQSARRGATIAAVAISMAEAGTT